MDSLDYYELISKLSKNEAKLTDPNLEVDHAIFKVLLPILINLDLNFPEAFKSVVERMEKNHAGL